ncbi:hypothetical protein [Flavilitoribacter nigricans]|uniref:Uncharacterized protein n=1 Tax=Flavilitoribacter nigricans (strain ATCC 23147 / DSM 23189 / NBRC 102662 / NCIMB 1420 / SS-2) TaxID=1122177 RepID=A0A2D0NER5_FLAN2|nr:hypothetical protein [Flavilitoribacter nigricans]PHN07001.1 hypothetical protein CRP01_08560 [Flavilitoribacter nigricans DSM 23189 = NBRC 102662]
MTTKPEPMQPKIIQVRGAAIEKVYDTINDEFRNDIRKDLEIVEELNFVDAYKTNKRGCHHDVYLGKTGTIIFRPFNFVDGLDNFCYFDLAHYAQNDIHALEFYQWSSKRESKLELWFDGAHQITASQKKSIRSNGKKELIRNGDVYETTDYYLRYIVGKTVGDLTVNDKILRCVSRRKRLQKIISM